MMEIDRIEGLVSVLEAGLERRKLELYTPYPRQADFHCAGGDPGVRERLLMAGNQLGKTLAASAEAAMHLTGDYPAWWSGAVFDGDVTAWAGSETSQSTRDTVQRLLLGEPGKWGTGMIPADKIMDIKRAAHGVADAVETIIVRRVGKKRGRVTIKTYDQGRERWQGETLDFVWFDEEPPADIYTEGLTRTNATDGIVFLTFTPLQGMSDVVRRFLVDQMPGTHVTQMGIEDAGHYTPEQRARIIASYPEHERDARIKGIPVLGSGRVFGVPEDQIIVEPMPIPAHWAQIGGLDFGWDHPTAAARLAWDRDADIVYVVADYRAREQTPILVAGALKPWGGWLPWAWPHDGLQHDKGSGEQLASQYRQHGLGLCKERATFQDGTNGVEAGIQAMLERMQTGRWKVFRSCQSWLEEYRTYHRKDGRIVKERDDTISASRYAYMMLRHARVRAEPEKPSAEWHPLSSTMGY